MVTCWFCYGLVSPGVWFSILMMPLVTIFTEFIDKNRISVFSKLQYNRVDGLESYSSFSKFEFEK